MYEEVVYIYLRVDFYFTAVGPQKKQIFCKELCERSGQSVYERVYPHI